MSIPLSVKILVVEDNLRLQQGLVQLLTEEGYSVDAISDGEEGLYRALEWRYDLIILDVMLPKMDGWRFMEKLRGKQNDTPVLMLTAMGELDDVVKGLNLGADEYLTKPYRERELVARIRALTRRSRGSAFEEIDLGRVTVNTLEQRAFRDGDSVNLTATEYRIVEYLARRAGSVISRPELLESILGDNEENFSNLLDVHIYNIRRKLGKDFLQNRRGLGYTVPSK